MSEMQAAVEEGVKLLRSASDGPLRLPAVAVASAAVAAAGHELQAVRRVRDKARSDQGGPTLPMLNAVCEARASLARREATLARAIEVETAAIEKFWHIQTAEMGAQDDAEYAEWCENRRRAAEAMTVAQAYGFVAQAERIREHTASCGLPVQRCEECSEQQNDSLVECFWDRDVPAAELKLAGLLSPGEV